MAKNKKESDKRYRTKKRVLIRNFYSKVGDNCFFCKSTKLLACHRIDFKKHNPIANLSIRLVNLENVNDYVRLCFECHYGVHWCHDFLDMSWEEIKSYL